MVPSRKAEEAAVRFPAASATLRVADVMTSWGARLRMAGVSAVRAVGKSWELSAL